MREPTKKQSELSQKSEKIAVAANPRPCSQAKVPVVTQPTERPQTQDTSVSNSASNIGLVLEQNEKRKKGLMDDVKSPTTADKPRDKSENRKSIMRFLSKGHAPAPIVAPRRSSTFPITKPTHRVPASPSSISRSSTSPAIMETNEKELEKAVEVRIEGRKWRDSDNDSLYCY